MSEAWMILVPTEKPAHFIGKKRFFSTRYHQQWDAKVMAISGGITILGKGKGYWLSPRGQLFREDMIQVEVSCTREQIQQIIDITARHYGQEAIYARKVSDDVLLIHFDREGRRVERGMVSPEPIRDVQRELDPTLQGIGQRGGNTDVQRPPEQGEG